MSGRREFLTTAATFLTMAACSPEQLFGPAKKRVITPDFFGHQVQGEWVQDDGSLCCPVSVYFGLLRLWDSRAVWWKMEDDTNALSANLRYAERVGADTMFVFGEPPASAVLPGKSKMPTKDAWVSFVKAIAAERIRYVELWNEPAEGYWDGTPEELVEYCRIAYPILSVTGKTVLSPSFTSSPYGDEFAQRFLSAGGGEWCDEIAFHSYVKSPSELPERIASVRASLEKYRAHRPIRNTEYNIVPFKPWQMAQSLLIQASLGVSGVVWNPETEESANDYTDSTMRVMADLLIGSIVGAISTVSGVSQCVVSKGSLDTELAWTDESFPSVQVRAAA